MVTYDEVTVKKRSTVTGSVFTFPVPRLELE